MNSPGRILLAVVVLAVMAAGNAEAQLPERLQHWLQPLPNCRTLSCIFRNIPTTPGPRAPTPRTWPTGNTGPITTTPEPLTIALLGTGLAGIGAAARRRKLENGGRD